MSERRYVAPGDWTGRSVDRPGLMWRKWQVEEYLARDAPPPRPVYPDRVLAHRRLRWNGVGHLAEVVELCNPAKLALGVTAKAPNGQLGHGWRWWALHGFGLNGTTGTITESLALRCEHRYVEQPQYLAPAVTNAPPRGALFFWVRPVPDPRVMACMPFFAYWGRANDWLWPMFAAVLRHLPHPTWRSELTTSWAIGPDGRPDDLPRSQASADVKAMVRE